MKARRRKEDTGKYLVWTFIYFHELLALVSFSVIFRTKYAGLSMESKIIGALWTWQTAKVSTA